MMANKLFGDRASVNVGRGAVVCLTWLQLVLY